MVVLGGLVPELLTGGEDSEAPTHLGTTDIDIHISLFADAESDVGPLEAALEVIDAKPDEGVDGWRWLIPSGGSRVRIEFLCDLEDQPEGVTVSIPGCQRLRAANLRGTGFVARDWAEEPIERVVDGETVIYLARFAGLEGYLLAKSYAARHRGAEKDYYDLVHVLLYNRAGGPGQAGAQLASGQFADDVSAARNLFAEIEARFGAPSDYAAQSYANQALRVNPEADPAQLAQDAVGAIAEFIAALDLP
ncbi:MAG: hypothetical protein ACRDLE_05420 [Gaiellaceae bacterium]